MSDTLNVTQAENKNWFRTVCGFMAHVMLVAVVIALGSALVPALSLSNGVNLNVNGEPFFSEGQVPNMTLRVLGIASFALVALVQAFGFIGLRRTFQETAQNRVFSERSVQGFRWFAYATLFVIFAQGVSDGLMEGIKNFMIHAEMGTFQMHVEMPGFSEIFNALLLLFAAHAFVIGTEVQDENDAFL